MGWVEVFSDTYIVGFILLFFRFGALFMAVPIFSHNSIPATTKASMAFFFTIVFYSSMPPLAIPITVPSIVLAILSELFFGLAIGTILQISFNVITFAGGQISFMMGFSMASAIDPQNGISMPIISQFLSLMALMVIFTIDMHHWMLLFIDGSLKNIPLGGFIMSENLFNYIIKAMSNMFMVGFMIAFPITALSWLADIIFGMLMKTMPQFNLLVIGFPIKIIVSFAILIATFTAIMLILKDQMLQAFNFLEMFF
ncbi:MAG: flagellar biosynthetic protein FliR [Sulfurimonas sp. RIFCSPHIGHO2_12_FULL_36_9]|jgi:flagellar biosynthetic protein FliR|uniref:flagellar biosynthetic protein FliR n=1 Tax=unclassified Sulfurimonas TaxID=2623549 RepID=UPI0008C357D3|nr:MULTISPECIES: flagellar biosynthetic protein FliR [unclassified Sulfurimonas]OHD98130.1 MAG: flagellar biosynthetic protein FliR [Sulfurimonas sp. RIFCSPLOWO2_02_FULL_36_28]OHD98894.1 MAG: flagellar biosynthetic protein FliR [Sulfurimonas sp. RIFCSPHIGHO2_12_FULL_36_9]OHE01271.1 MAG: flagellar biosynthetic protein FliR [Sulfurimonas sp. RIFCSPLOWO2_12_36_12]OHE02430.1 MAG: flagellar biosynthetic protein FliR [Sulfurimonas sp. RIFCSPLOWO2_12_FULL_36_74]